MSGGRTYVLGAGLAGLAAATRLAEQGRGVILIEPAPQAGGRCRSFHDKQLGADIDNGNHLVLSGNRDAMTYLNRIGAMQSVEVLPARIPFKDLKSGRAWSIDMGEGRIPWWILRASTRVPGTRLVDYWRSRKVMRAGSDDTVAEVLGGTGLLYERFWKPFAIAVLNTEPERAAAALLIPVIEETLGRGAPDSRPVVCRRGLGFSFAEPALDYLRARGADVRLGARCRGIETGAGRVVALDIDGTRIALGDGDGVVLAVPPAVAVGLVPGIDAPDAYRAIVNAHFDVGETAGVAPITGLLGGLAEWLFVRGRIASVTVSAADAVVDEMPEALAARIWGEIAPFFGAGDLPPWRIIKEKRATIAQTPEMLRRRPKTATMFQNLVLAGDWTDTGLPATIEGALRSGHRAAHAALNT